MCFLSESAGHKPAQGCMLSGYAATHRRTLWNATCWLLVIVAQECLYTPVASGDDVTPVRRIPLRGDALTRSFAPSMVCTSCCVTFFSVVHVLILFCLLLRGHGFPCGRDCWFDGLSSGSKKTHACVKGRHTEPLLGYEVRSFVVLRTWSDPHAKLVGVSRKEGGLASSRFSC